jgi:tetratricopeptide (TPR) repeat protein
VNIRAILLGVPVLILLLYVMFSGTSHISQLSKAYASYTEGERATTIATRKEAFNSSLQFYSELEKSYSPKYGDGKLYFNIANCFFQLGEYPWAIYYYNEAHYLRPRDSRVTQNLEIAQKKQGIQVDKGASSLIGLSLPERLQLFFIFSLLAFGFASIQIWSYGQFWKKLALVFSGLAVIVFLNLIYIHYLGDLQGILVDSASLHRDAGEQYAKVSEKPILAGNKVVVLDTKEHGEWLKVQTPDGELGFIQKNAIRIIDTK